MHRATDIFRKTALATAILSVSACGGGGSGSGGSTSGPISGTQPTPVTASGVITGFGSIYVNGVRYDTSDSEVEFEDDEGPKSEDDLRLGMKVEVEGTRSGSSRVADRVRYDRDLKGPVASVTPDPANPQIGTLTLLGQTVVVDTNTVFDDLGDANRDGSIDIRDLAPGAGPVVVEVSGFATTTGFLATRIEGSDSDDDDEAEVKGVVANLDEAAGTFTVRGLSVSYDGSDLDTEDFGDDDLANGMFVEVKGTLLGDGTLDATRIELEDDLESGDDDDGSEFEIEGILQAVDTAADPDTVTIDGIVVPVSDASRLVGLEGRRVELEGTFNAAGVLVLRTGSSGVKVETENVIRIEDRVANVAVDSFTTRLGVVVTPTGTSRVEDDDSDDEDGDRLTPAEFLTRLQPGDYIEARGYLNADGSISWSRIERDDDDDMDCSLRGPVDANSIADPNFAILGVTIDTSGISSSDDFQDDDIAIGRDAFFDRLAAGAVVEAKSEESEGACSDGLLLAREVEFEDDDGVYGSSDDDDDDDSDDDDSDSSDD